MNTLTALKKPLESLQWVPRHTLKANDYNPNAVSKDNLQLLIHSILTNGWTSPIVCTADMTIIDGFHRWLVAGIEPLLSMLDGKVPIVIVAHDDPSKNIYGTITHNRARGVHQLGPMKAIIKALLEAGKSIDEISKQLGMRAEEVFRLSSFGRDEFLALMSRGASYSTARALIDV